ARFVEAAEQVDDGRLAAAGRPHKGNRFTPAHVQVEVGQHRLVLFIVEIDVVEHDIAAKRLWFHSIRPVTYFGHGVNQRENALGRGNRLLHFSVDAGHFLDGPEHEGDVGEERLDTTDSDASG